MSAIIVTPEGICKCLYTEAIDLTAIGTLLVKRATHVIFDNTTSTWVVRNMRGRELQRYPSRQACLNWEREYLEHRETIKHGGELRIDN